MPAFPQWLRNRAWKRSTSCSRLYHNFTRHDVKLENDSTVVHGVQDLCFSGQCLSNQSWFRFEHVDVYLRLIESLDWRAPWFVDHLNVPIGSVSGLILVAWAKLGEFAALRVFVQNCVVVVFDFDLDDKLILLVGNLRVKGLLLKLVFHFFYFYKNQLNINSQKDLL